MARRPTMIDQATADATARAAVSSELAMAKARVQDIMESPEAKRNPDAALKLAIDSTMPAADVRALLKTMEPASPYLKALDLYQTGIPAGGVPMDGKSTPSPIFTAPGDREARRAEIREVVQTVYGRVK